MSLEYNGYPSDYYEKYLKPDKLTYIAVGNPETFEKPLSEFGKVTNIELTKPVIE
jgi:hypothetical protein